MTATQFQALALGFVAALLVVIPAAGTVAIVALQTWRKITDVAQAQGATAATVAQHDHQLNGALNERIDQRSKAVVAQHVRAESIVAAPTPTAPLMPEPIVAVTQEDLAVLSRLAEVFDRARSGVANAASSTGSSRGSGISGNTPASGSGPIGS